MVKVYHDQDYVILALDAKRDYIALTCGQAEELENALLAKAADAGREEPSINQGRPWGCKVVSYDGMVGIKFFPPFGARCDRVPLPPKAARALAGRIAFCRQQAAYKMRFEFAKVGAPTRNN